MTFKKRRERKTRYARNKEKDNTKTIINDSMYVSSEYAKLELTEAGNVKLVFKDQEYTNSPVLPVIKDKRVSLLQRIKNFINKLLK